MPASPVATVVFPTRNRRENLLAAIAAARAQTVPLEILVLDDGSTDDSAEAVAARFHGEVAYHRVATDRGPAFQRNRGIELARAPIVFPLDDDAELVSPRTVEQTLAEFDQSCIGAVGIPYVNVRIDSRVEQRAPNDACSWVCHTFTGASHAVRRDAFLSVGGYREHWFYMGEEGDLTLRMLTGGFVTRVGNADPVHHHESPQRVTARANFYGRRNDVLFALHNVPAFNLPAHLAGTVFNGLRAVGRARYPLQMLRGLAAGFYEGVHQWKTERRPAPPDIYRLYRRLKKGGPMPLAEIERLLPPRQPLSEQLFGHGGGPQVENKRDAATN